MIKRFGQVVLFWVVLFLTGVVFLTMTKGIVWAQDGANDGGLHLTTSPLPINLITEPGATVSAELRIKNGGIKPEMLTVELMKFDAYGDEGMPRLMEREEGDDFFDWVTFSEDDFEVLPNEWKTITATFSIPESAAFGYYYAVTFSRAKEKESGLGQTAIAGATATLVLVEVRVANAKREVEVVEFTADRSSYEFLPVSFNIKLRNGGNVHVAPRGNIFIDKGLRRDVAILEINESKGNILPDSNRVFVTSWEDGFPVYVNQIENDRVVLDELGVAKKKLKWDLSQTGKLRWGKYSAKMLLVYDDGTRDIPIEGRLSFWVMPWRLIGVGGLVLSLSLIGFWSTLEKIVLKIFRKKKPILQ